MKEKLLNLLKKCNSVKEILEGMNYCYHVHSYKRLKNNMNDNGLGKEYEDFKEKSKKRKRKEFALYVKNKKKIGKECLVENSRTSRQVVKRVVLQHDLLEYKCFNCNVKNKWNGKELVLQLDHINGINNDNRIENLRFLCPNCHSQTETYSGKNNANRCPDCGVRMSSKSIKCRKCSNVDLGKKRRKFEVSKNDLEKLLETKTMVGIGKLFGVSDNAIRKRAKKLGLI